MFSGLDDIVIWLISYWDRRQITGVHLEPLLQLRYTVLATSIYVACNYSICCVHLCYTLLATTLYLHLMFMPPRTYLQNTNMFSIDSYYYLSQSAPHRYMHACTHEAAQLLHTHVSKDIRVFINMCIMYARACVYTRTWIRNAHKCAYAAARFTHKATHVCTHMRKSRKLYVHT